MPLIWYPLARCGARRPRGALMPRAQRLLFANQTEGDILLREALEETAQAHRNFHLWYTLDRPPQKWAFSMGFVNDTMIQAHLPPPAEDTQVRAQPWPWLQLGCGLVLLLRRVDPHVRPPTDDPIRLHAGTGQAWIQQRVALCFLIGPAAPCGEDAIGMLCT